MDSQLDPIVIKRLKRAAVRGGYDISGSTMVEAVLAELRKDYAIVPLKEAGEPGELPTLQAEVDRLEAELEDAQGEAAEYQDIALREADAGKEATSRADAAEDEAEKLRGRAELAERIVSDLELYVAQTAVRSDQDPYSRGAAVKHFTFLAELAAEGRAKLREAEEAATKSGTLNYAAANVASPVHAG